MDYSLKYLCVWSAQFSAYETPVNYAPYQRHFFPHHLWTQRNAPRVAAARGNESERWGVLMTDPGLVKICFCLQSSGLFDQPQSYVEPRGCCSEWRKTSGTHSFPLWAECSIWGLHSLLCIIWTGIFTAFASITPFIILLQVTHSDSHLEARMSRYLLEVLCIMSWSLVRMPVRIIVIMATKGDTDNSPRLCSGKG